MPHSHHLNLFSQGRFSKMKIGDRKLNFTEGSNKLSVSLCFSLCLMQSASHSTLNFNISLQTVTFVMSTSHAKMALNAQTLLVVTSVNALTVSRERIATKVSMNSLI